MDIIYKLIENHCNELILCLNYSMTVKVELFALDNQSQKMYSFVSHSKMNGKVGFYASFPL